MHRLPSATIRNIFVSTRPVKNAEEVNISDEHGEIVETYYHVKNSSQRFNMYSHFIYVFNSDGSLWGDANLFLFYKVKKNPKLSPRRMRLFASALTEFQVYCAESKTAYKDHKDWDYEDTPTHRFRNHLIDRRSPKTGKRIMSVIAQFYEWLLSEGGLITSFPLWDAKQVTTKNGYVVTTKDICQFPGEKTSEETTETYVTDGEHLRPLSEPEQEAILQAVREIGNPEYKLAFYISLESKARKQTILTLRLHHFVKSLPVSASAEDVHAWFKTITWPEDTDEEKIMVGTGYDADSKKGKFESYPIYIHGWLWKRVVVYIASQRAFARRRKALSQKEELKQYLFLSQRGNAMYHAKNDLYCNNLGELGLKSLKEGGALDKWIDETLKPKMEENGHSFPFKFHDLRATSAANFLKTKRKMNGSYRDKNAWYDDIEELSIRMNHSSTDVTWGYLKHKSLEEEKPMVQANYEVEMVRLISCFDDDNTDIKLYERISG